MTSKNRLNHFHYLIDKLNPPKRSNDRESAPHYITIQSGLKVSITLLVIFLKISK